MFPPVEIHEISTSRPEEAKFFVLFQSSSSHGLLGNLYCCFIIELIDKASQAIKISFGAYLSTELSTAPHSNTAVRPWLELVFHAATIETHAQELLYIIFDKAQSREVVAPNENIALELAN
jgi:hypothetical protein